MPHLCPVRIQSNRRHFWMSKTRKGWARRARKACLGTLGLDPMRIARFSSPRHNAIIVSTLARALTSWRSLTIDLTEILWGPTTRQALAFEAYTRRRCPRETPTCSQALTKIHLKLYWQISWTNLQPRLAKSNSKNRHRLSNLTSTIRKLPKRCRSERNFQTFKRCPSEK